ncbi:MAG TPA: ABC transporter permease subunit [Thermoplasmata archaeon]|nr:ABC transporter permease subunit [Thermoplasmata archaeon]
MARESSIRPDGVDGPANNDCAGGTGRPTAPRSATRTLPLPSAGRALAIYAAIPIAVAAFGVASFGPSFGPIASYLPTATRDVSFSFLRLCAAYAASLGFALAYGYYAATRPPGERIMIPVLDILQSVPILGFFPVVIVLFVNLTPNSWLGPNLASVFLIFTSMSWNMVFGVYESVKTLPSELRESADSFGAHGWLRFRWVLFPATVNRLVYNSVLSWTRGWFFLVEAEIFTTNTHALPGIGSFLSFAASDHNTSAFLAGLIVLVIVIAVLDFVVWRPLGRWAERFRYDTAPSGEGEISGAPRGTSGRFRRAAAYVTRGVRTGVSRISTPFVQLASITVGPVRKPTAFQRSVFYYLTLGGILVLVWLILIEIVVNVYAVFTGPISSLVRQQLLQLPFAMGASTLRIAGAYGICLAIALPLAIYLARRPTAARVGLPMVEVIASFPATALFPVIIFELVPYLGPNGASILMLLTGMLWYLFFNLLSGVRGLAPDLEEAARSFGLKGRQFFRRVLFPGIFPALVTGSITAFGGGWNTLIVAEYLNVNSHQTLSVLGIGQMIDIGYAEPGGFPLMVAALFTLIATVVAINELLWKPLYRRAVEQFRYD